MESGEYWVFRAGPKAWGAPVRRVRIVRVGGPGRRSAVHVRFLDGEEEGLQEWVSSAALPAPWAEVDAFRADDEAEARLAEASRDVRSTPEFEAARLVLGLVRPKNRLRLRRAVADAGVLEGESLRDLCALSGVGEEELLEGDASLLHTDRIGRCLAGWPVTERVARGVARVQADLVLAEVDRRRRAVEEERSQPVWSSWSRRRSDEKLGSDEAALRIAAQWCGGESVERYDELVALRAEVVRLGELVERSVGALRERGHHVIAATIERDLGVHISSLGSETHR